MSCVTLGKILDFFGLSLHLQNGDDNSVYIIGLLKSPAIIVELLIFPYSSVGFASFHLVSQCGISIP